MTSATTKKTKRALVTLVALLAACSGKSGSDSASALAEDGTDASELESAPASFTATLTLPTTNPVDVNEALAAAAKTHAFFLPAGCLTSTVDPKSSTVTYVLSDCSGPWGLSHATGTIVAVYSTTGAAGQSALKIDLHSDSLKLRKGTVTFHGTATLTANGASREMTWTSDAQGTTARGRPLQRKATWDVKWTVGEACLLANGTAEGDVASRSIVTTLTNYQRCRGECPGQGGKIDVKNTETGDEVSVEFNGGNHATFKAGSGAATDITLACGL